MDATQMRVASILKTCDLRKATISAKSDTAGSISRIAVGEFITADDIFDATKLATAAALSAGGTLSVQQTGFSDKIAGPQAAAIYADFTNVPVDLLSLSAFALNAEARQKAIARATEAREQGKALLDNMLSDATKTNEPELAPVEETINEVRV